MSAGEIPAVRRARRWRFAVVQLLQLPAVGLLLLTTAPAALWTACLFGSVVCCAGTDSGWRWLNRLLVAQAIGWLALALIAGIPAG